MLSYIIRRLLLMPPTLIGITAMIFFVMALSPGGMGASIINAEGGMRPAERAARLQYLNQRYHLDRPYIVQYLSWLNAVSPLGHKPAGEGFPSSWRLGFKVPDLGESFTRNRKVTSIVADSLPVTLTLQLISLPITYLVAIFTGIQAARMRGKFIDIASGTILIAQFSIPTIWAGVLFIGYLCNKDYVHWFPANGLHDTLADSMRFLPTIHAGHFERGWLLDTIWHLILPIVCISYGSFAVLSKLTRAALLDTINQDFVRTARAKGLSERVVLYRHAFRNSLIVLITVAASILPALVVGSVVVETIFGLQGMGKLLIDAIESRDRELILSTELVISMLTLVGYLLADVGYAIADPRVSFQD
jgi:ABC-type dipeptide/oligopeptide/nickel transport system permease component